MLLIHDSLILPENSEILASCQGESEFLKYFVYYLSTEELLISCYNKQNSQITYEFVPWAKNHRILCFQFSNFHAFLHIITTTDYYIILSFDLLLSVEKRKKWEEIIEKQFLYSEISGNIKNSDSSVKM